MANRRRIAVVGTVGFPAKYGGFETLVSNLVYAAPDHIEYLIFAQSSKFRHKLHRYGRHKIRYLPFPANGISSVIYDAISLIIGAFTCEDILVLGVSGGLIIPLIRVLFPGRTITNIDGIEWRRGKWNRYASIFLRVSEALAVFGSNRIVADNAAIAKYVWQTYGRPSETIPYGGDQGDGILGLRPAQLPSVVEAKTFALSIARIEPENNCHLILRSAKTMGLPIAFVGNWEVSEYSRKLFSDYSSTDNIYLISNLYDIASLVWLRENCILYIHGHSAGGTNPSLVEAMWHGPCVIAFDCLYNRETTKNQATYFSGEASLEKCIEELVSAPMVRQDIGEAMRLIAHNEYRWKHVNACYIGLFDRSEGRLL